MPPGIKPRKDPNRPKLVLKVGEAARELGVAQQHVLNLIDEGKIGAINVAGDETKDRKYWRIPCAEMEKFKARRQS